MIGGGWIGVLGAVLAAVGLVVMTLGVVGMYRLPDTYGRLHAASKSVPLGVVALVIAAALLGEGDSLPRSSLIAVFLLVTAPVSSHVIGRAARRAGEPMTGDRVIDESAPGRCRHADARADRSGDGG